MRKNSGFTLVELMIVIVVVGILAAVAIPKFTMASHKAKCSEFPTILTSCYIAQHAYLEENDRFSVCTPDDDNQWNEIGMDNPNRMSKYFEYLIHPPNDNTFTAFATAKSPIGNVITGDDASINQDGEKEQHPDYNDYVKNWR